MTGPDLAGLRRHLKMTQREFAAQLGVSRQTVMRLEASRDEIPLARERAIINLADELRRRKTRPAVA